MNRLAGKVAIITGSGKGIGAAGARRMAEEGAKVVVADFSADDGQSVVAEIKAKGGDALFVQTDVTKEDSVKRMFETTIQKYGKLNIMYNNAGGSRSGIDTIITETPVEEFWRVISVDLFGHWICAKHAVPLLKETQGCIINTSSIVAIVARAKLSAYSCAKGGVAAMTRQLARDLAPFKIRVNAVAPGVTLSERIAKRNAERPGYTGEENLLGFVQPVDIANMVVYLASDEARVTTGQVIPVDSGLTMS